jgi:hypothetical protein
LWVWAGSIKKCIGENGIFVDQYVPEGIRVHKLARDSTWEAVVRKAHDLRGAAVSILVHILFYSSGSLAGGPENFVFVLTSSSWAQHTI